MLIFSVKNASKIQFMLYDETNQTFFLFNFSVLTTDLFNKWLLTGSRLASSGYQNRPETHRWSQIG
jgi:hypothetical protein